MDSATLSEIDADLASRLAEAVPPPVCEWQESRDPEPCAAPANWLCIMACGHTWYYCEAHATERRRFCETPGANFCRGGRAARPQLHDGPRLADPVRFERIER